MGQELIISTQSSNMDFLLYFLFIIIFSMFFLFIKKYTESKRSIFLFIINLLFLFSFCTDQLIISKFSYSLIPPFRFLNLNDEIIRVSAVIFSILTMIMFPRKFKC
ncbi:hypothetical protein TI10_19500 [Photorhabdus luminescens subsp. luminescens]|uniref:Uncharacterized protein n=1 Tax=Photorhabdus luminescens TaxID=29488 RepID=A0A1G5R834_PHOLU|nr:hypothetical protein TI10_19500 [Photorhabdus luminescens subsp. luminescens]SCZ69551.1 hypothetical protein SAMN02982990_03294 [Photorhabdus luminescens]